MSPSFSPPESPPASPPGGESDGESGRKPADARDVADVSRIARAGRILRAEAARTLDKRRPPGRRRVPARQEPLPPPGLEAGLSPAERADLVEALDADGRPLACLPLDAALRQGLRVRRVVVALRTRKNRIVLYKRGPDAAPPASPASPASAAHAAKAVRAAKAARPKGAALDPDAGMSGVWSPHVGFVRVGEAQEDSAERLLLEEAALSGLEARLLIREDDGPGGNRALFVAELPAGLYPLHPAGEFLEVDADELAGLVRDAADLLAPETRWAAGVPGLFR